MGRTPLTGKAVLVTGAASGIGRAAARLLAAAGAAVALLDQDGPGLAAAQAEVRALGGRGLTRTVDVTDPAETGRAVHQAWAELGAIDAALHCAGILRLGEWETVPLAEARRCMEVNFFGTLHCIQAVLPLMRRRGSGHLINMGSVAALRGLPHLAAYSASKFAVYGLSQALRDELHGSGIAVSVVCPPVTRTPMVTRQPRLPPIYHRFPWLRPEQVATAILKALVTRRFLVTVDGRTRGLLLLDRLCPWLVDRLVRAWSR